VEKALALDPTLAEAYVARGNMAWTIERGFDHEAATRDFRRAIELNPRLAAGHEALGAVYHHVGLNERALQEFRTGIELDPHSNFGKFRIPRVLLYQGKFAEALSQLERAPDRDTNWHWPLALWYNGRPEEALSAARDQLNRHPNPGDVLSVCALILAGTGRAKEAEAEIAEAIRLESGGSHFHHAAYNIASAYALMGRNDSALQWLKRVAREGFPNYELFLRDPNLNSLRRDAEFRRFLDEQRKLWEHYAAVL
jgi:tetratricopeptide (TPR) repeat protein